MDQRVSKIIAEGLLTPKPSVDISLCQECNKMTDNWYSDWPKDKKIIWMCKKCRDEKTKKIRQDLETILEKMCDEESH